MPHHDDPDHVVVEGGEPVHLAERPVLVVDFGAQYAQLIARRVREASCFSEVVPHSMPVAEMLAKEPAAVILSGGPSSVYEEGAPSLDPALLEAGVPVFGMCYGFQAMARALGGTVEKTGLSRVRGHAGRRPRHLVDAVQRPAVGAVGVDEPRRLGVRGPGRDEGHGHDVRSAGGRVRGRRPPALRRAVAPRGAALDVRPAGARELPDPRGRPDGGVDRGERRRRPRRLGARAGRRGPRHLRAVRRRRLVGGGRAGAEGGRRPADLRVRRPRAAALGRGRAGREGLRGGHRRRPRRRRRPGAVPVGARRGVRPRGEAQDHRPRVHPGLRAGGARCRGVALGGVRPPGRVPRPGHAVPRRRRVRRRHRHREHQVAPQRRRAARRPAVQAGRAAAAALQGRGAPGRARARACPRPSCGASRSRAPGSASASSAR